MTRRTTNDRSAPEGQTRSRIRSIQQFAGRVTAKGRRPQRVNRIKKPHKTRGSRCFMGKRVPPLGPEQPPETRGSRPAIAVAVPLAVPSVQGDDEQTAEMLARWAGLDAAARADVLAVVRGLAMRSDVP